MAHRTLWFSSDDMSEKISSGTKKKRTNKKVKTNVKQSVLFRKLKSSNLGPVVQIYTTYSDMGFFSHEKLVLFDTIKQSIFHQRKLCFCVYKLRQTFGSSMFDGILPKSV